MQGSSVTAAPSRGHADTRAHLTLEPEGGGDRTAGLAPTLARLVQGVPGPRTACPPELADLTPALFWQRYRVSVCATRDVVCLSVGRGGGGTGGCPSGNWMRDRPCGFSVGSRAARLLRSTRERRHFVTPPFKLLGV